jgi:hypothetical protein
MSLQYITPLELVERDLSRVGPNKPLGYLLTRDIEEAGLDPLDFQAALLRKGITAVTFDWWNRPVFVAYHKPTLAALLENHKDTLLSENWPLSPNEFARFVIEHDADCDEQPELYDLIAKAFADYETLEYVRGLRKMTPQEREERNQRLIAAAEDFFSTMRLPIMFTISDLPSVSPSS